MDGVKFEIRAPLASWSEGGVIYRPTDLAPSWSALTGMVGAALGWERGDERLARLAADYAPVVRVDGGQRVVDYHTVESPKRTAIGRRRVWSRADEISGDTHTTPSRREYVADATYTVWLVPLGSDPVVAPDQIARALEAPRFALYAGRRGCLLGSVQAQVAEVDVEAATHWDTRVELNRRPSMVRERRDLLVGPRQFAVRLEAVA